MLSNLPFPHSTSLLLLYKAVICATREISLKKRKNQIKILPLLLNVIEEEVNSIVVVAIMVTLSPLGAVDLLLQVFPNTPLVVVLTQTTWINSAHMTPVEEHHLKEVPFSLITISNSNLKSLLLNAKSVTRLVIQHLNVGTGMITPMKLMKYYLKLLPQLLCQMHTIMIQTGILILVPHLI